MKTRKDTLTEVQSRLAGLGELESRAMFGGLGLLIDGTLVALVRDEVLFVRHPGEPAVGEGFQPFPHSRLRLNFQPVDEIADLAWLDACRATLAEVQALADRIPARSSFRATRLD